MPGQGTNVKAVGHLHGAGVWVESGILTNPQPNDVIIDTGELGPGNYLFAVTGFCDVSWEYDIRLMDAANITVKHFVHRNPPSGPDDWLAPNKVELLLSERLKIVCTLGPGPAGRVQLAIFRLEMG